MENGKNITSQILGWSYDDYYWHINCVYLIMFTITIISILIISFLVWVANRFLPLKICPICAGVSGTWVWILGSRFFGYEVDLMILAILMGGSVVGLSSKLDKNWKILLTPLGFIVVYNLLLENWTALFASFTLFLLMLFLFLPSSKRLNSDRDATKELRQKMKKCC